MLLQELQHIHKKYSWTYWPNAYESLLLIGNTKIAQLAAIDKEQGHKFGFLNYDLKNKIEKLSSPVNPQLQFPDFSFFKADFVQKGDKQFVGKLNDFTQEKPLNYTTNQFEI